MTIKLVSILFDKPVFFAGETVTGHVTIVIVSKPKTIKGIRVLLQGKAKFKWNESENYTDSDGKSQSRVVTRLGKEKYLDAIITLIAGKLELPIGEHVFPFCALLPTTLPATFSGRYGQIAYCGIVTVKVSMAFDKIQKEFFQVENLLDLNRFPNLKSSLTIADSKHFCCFCCVSGPLILVLRIPKSGYAKIESIPVTVEVDNASSVTIGLVTLNLCRKIIWKATSSRKTTKDIIKTITLGMVHARSAQTWTERMILNCGPFPNISDSRKITLTYALKVVAKPDGAYTDLRVKVPVTIGDIPLHVEDYNAPLTHSSFQRSGNYPSPPLADTAHHQPTSSCVVL